LPTLVAALMAADRASRLRVVRRSGFIGSSHGELWSERERTAT